MQVVDSLPLPVCGDTRSRRDRCVKPWADDGYCAAKKLDDYGFKLGLCIARSGMITACPLLPARPHDSQMLDVLVAGFRGVAPADKGFVGAARHALLAARHGVQMIVPPRTPHPRRLLRACARIRKHIEMVGAHLTERFVVARIRVHDLWHVQHRLIRKILPTPSASSSTSSWAAIPLPWTARRRHDCHASGAHARWDDILTHPWPPWRGGRSPP